MFDFVKTLYLPSGGLEYDPLIWMRRLPSEIRLIQSDNNACDSQFEYFTILTNYCAKLPVPIADLLLQDFYFLWTNILVTDIYTNNDFRIHKRCNNCTKDNLVMIPFEELNFTQINLYTDNRLSTYTFEMEEYEITIRFRRVRDNLEAAAQRLYYNSEVIYPNIILFMLPQIISIKQNHNEVDKSNYFEILTNMCRRSIIAMYEIIEKFQNTFGLSNQLQFNCVQCKTANTMSIYDDFALSTITPYPHKNNMPEVFKSLFELARLPIWSFDDVKQIPLAYTEALYLALEKMEFKSGMVMM